MTYLHGLVMAVLLVLGIVFIPQFLTTGRVEQYQYDNVRVQRNLVDRRLEPIEVVIGNLGDRVRDSESRINIQLRETDRVTRDLEDLMFIANPREMMQFTKDRAAQAHKELGINVNQTANPIINVSPHTTITK